MDITSFDYYYEQWQTQRQRNICRTDDDVPRITDTIYMFVFQKINSAPSLEKVEIVALDGRTEKRSTQNNSRKNIKK